MGIDGNAMTLRTCPILIPSTRIPTVHMIVTVDLYKTRYLVLKIYLDVYPTVKH